MVTAIGRFLVGALIGGAIAFLAAFTFVIPGAILGFDIDTITISLVGAIVGGLIGLLAFDPERSRSR